MELTWLVAEGGDWVNPHPLGAVTDSIPAYNNGHNHSVKIYYDIVCMFSVNIISCHWCQEETANGPQGFLTFYWTSDFEGHPSWGTLDQPIFRTKVNFDALDKRDAYIGASTHSSIFRPAGNESEDCFCHSGLTSTSSGLAVQTVDILAWTYHELQTFNNQPHSECMVTYDSVL
jgi:hypothetical protein